MSKFLHVLTGLLFLIQHNFQAQSIAFNDASQLGDATVFICEGKSLNLKAVGFLEGTPKKIEIPKSKRYEWAVPDKAKKVVERNDFEITISDAKVEHSGLYTVTDKNDGSQVKMTVKVLKKPEKPVITYVLSEARLSVVDESDNSLAASKFEWTLPNGLTLKDRYDNTLDVKEFDTRSPKVSDLGEYKLAITNNDGCTSSSSTTVTIKHELAATEKKDTKDSTKKDWFFYGNIGGSADLINRGIGVNSVYTDIQFRPSLTLDDNWKLNFPIRIFYNNGTGPQQSDVVAPQRFTTVDTVTLAKMKKIRYLIDEPLLVNKVESRIIGLNIPISFARKLNRNENWSFLFGLNMDFTWITNRTFGYAYTGGDSTFITADAIPNLPRSITMTAPNGETVVRSNTVRYDTVRFRGRVPIDRQYDYSQLFVAFQVGVEHKSSAFDFSLKYSYGNSISYITRTGPGIGGYNHYFQMIFFEKNIGVQLLADVRLADINQDGNGTKTASAAPYYYISLAKTINLSALKELFFK